MLLGVNAVGKSSLLQALLLLRSAIQLKTIAIESATKRESSVNNESDAIEVPLNGPYNLRLGRDIDVLGQYASAEDAISVVLEDKGGGVIGSAEFKLPLGDEDHLWLDCDSIILSAADSVLQRQDFHYLNAERQGPRVQQEMHTLAYQHTSWDGRYTAQVLWQNDRHKIPAKRQCPSNRSLFLPDQVNAWLATILPGVQVTGQGNSDLQCAQIKVRNRMSRESLLATNVGFGISYALPIIVSALLAHEGSMLIVENPEAHLHPAAQSAMGDFLSVVASWGVQVLVETHSDHVLTGMQISVARRPEIKELVNICLLSDHENTTQIDNIHFDEMAQFDHWPAGFMDQTQLDFMQLTEIRQERGLRGV